MDFTAELARLMTFVGDTARAIRMYSAYNPGGPSAYLRIPTDSKREAVDLMFLSDALHHFSSLGWTIVQGDPALTVKACDELLGAFAHYDADHPEPGFLHGRRTFELWQPFGVDLNAARADVASIRDKAVAMTTLDDAEAAHEYVMGVRKPISQPSAAQGHGCSQMIDSETRVSERLNFTDALGALLRCSRMYGVRLVCVAPDGEAMLERLGLRLIEADVIDEADKTRFVHEIGALTLDCSKAPLGQFGKDVSAATAMVRDPT